MEARITKKTAYTLVALAIVAFGVFSRFVPHAYNFVPITALSLLAAAYLPRRFALLVPLVIMAVTDIFIGLHNTVPFTWGSYVLIALIGSVIYAKTRKRYAVALFAPIAALLFFVVTNFGVWSVSNMYPHSLAGLATCYTLALPFFRATAQSDIIFTPIIFASVALMIRLVKMSTIRLGLQSHN